MLTPTQEFRRTHLRKTRELPRGLDAVVDGWVGQYQRRTARRVDLLTEARKVDALSAQFAGLVQEDLRVRLVEYRELFLRHNRLQEEARLHALAAIREAAARTLGLRAFPVQLACSLALCRGMLAEMGTGEGKTLSVGLAAVMLGWSGKPCHVITVNDYLARRDAEWLRPLFSFCGLRTGFVTGAMVAEERTKGYAADVTYCTGKEIVADFLRDRLHLGKYQNASRRQLLFLLQPRLRHLPGVVMRGIHSAIVDEADSVMIDEAVTPVIIAASRPNETLKMACRVAREIADGLERGSDYTINEKFREIELGKAGLEKVAQLSGALPGLWRGSERRREIITQALTARDLFHLGRHYAIKEGKVHIVDEFTGRIMQQRTWRAGLHQAIEVKENLEVTDPTETLARLSFQRFFRFFAHLSGTTGTAMEAAGEFWHVYRLPVVAIPPNRPCQRQQLPQRIFAYADAKWDAVVDEVKSRHQLGQPILIGTQGISESERLSERFDTLGLAHHVLNAVRDGEEAQIVALAGRRGQITIATNMAGRGTDITLGPGVEALGGLHVISTNRHESGRVDRQLFGRCARQGEAGSARAFLSIDEDVPVRFAPKAARMAAKNLLHGKSPGAHVAASTLLHLAQKNAERAAFRRRMSVLSMDTWLEDSLSFAGMEYG